MRDLEQAILQRNMEEVKRLLTEDANLIDARDSEGVEMSFLAARSGSLALVRFIVEYTRANMNITDDRHRNMLHYGVMSGNLEVCRYLTERVGLSPLAGDIDRETPWELAARLGFDALARYFESRVGAPLTDMYKNPIRTGFFPDPSIVRVGSDYYMVNSSFVFFPCIPISHSRDLIHWRIIGHAITNPDWCMLDGLEGGRGYWAPDISYYKGRFYITATYRLNDTGTVLRRQIVVSSERPEGPYTKPAIIDEDGIDPSIFTDDDGRRYMLLNRGARIFELNAECTEKISDAELLYYGDNKRAPEGPHLLKKDGWYYLFEAEGGTGEGHMITVSRSRTLKGVYEPCPYNPIMRQTDPGAAIQRCGHGKPVETPEGDWYMVYLCGRKVRGADGSAWGLLGRETAIDPITWTADGWPIVNRLQGPSCLQVKPRTGNRIAADSSATDSPASGAFGVSTDVDQDGHFSAEAFSRYWMSPRAPEPDGFSFDDGALLIKAGARDLDSIDARGIAVRRQTAFDFDAACVMELPDALPAGADCGMLCYYDENTWVKFGVFLRDDVLSVGVVEKIGDTLREHGFVPLSPARDLALRIETRGLQRRFLCGAREIAVLDNVYYLCDEGIRKGKRFTGATIGMYAFAGEGPLYRAAFRRFSYLPSGS